MLLEVHIMMFVCVGSWLTPANQGLLVVGVILLSVAIVLGVIITSMVFKKGIILSFTVYSNCFLFCFVFLSPLGPWLSLGLSMTGFVVTFVSLVLWVVVGFHVGLQKSKNVIDYFMILCIIIIIIMQIHVILLGSLLEMVS